MCVGVTYEKKANSIYYSMAHLCMYGMFSARPYSARQEHARRAHTRHDRIVHSIFYAASARTRGRVDYGDASINQKLRHTLLVTDVHNKIALIAQRLCGMRLPLCAAAMRFRRWLWLWRVHTKAQVVCSSSSLCARAGCRVQKCVNAIVCKTRVFCVRCCCYSSGFFFVCACVSWS